jgi:hypothetical protein
MTHHTLEASSSFTRTRKRLSPTGKKYKKEGGAKWVPFFFREKKKIPSLLALSFERHRTVRELSTTSAIR